MGPGLGVPVGKRARGGNVVEELPEKKPEDKVKERWRMMFWSGLMIAFNFAD